MKIIAQWIVNGPLMIDQWGDSYYGSWRTLVMVNYKNETYYYLLNDNRRVSEKDALKLIEDAYPESSHRKVIK